MPSSSTAGARDGFLARRRLLLLRRRHLLPRRLLSSSSTANGLDDGGGGCAKTFDRDLKRRHRHRDRAAWAMREADGFVNVIAENLLDYLEDCRKAFPSVLCLSDPPPPWMRLRLLSASTGTKSTPNQGGDDELVAEIEAMEIEEEATEAAMDGILAMKRKEAGKEIESAGEGGGGARNIWTCGSHTSVCVESEG